MKSNIKKIIINIMSIFKIKNIIVFESNADYTDNSRAFYEYLIEKGYNTKYKIYWFVNDGKKFKNRECENVKFITMWKNTINRSFFQWIKYFWICKNAKYLISSNRTLHKLNKKTITININHGTPLKRVKDLKIVPKNIDMVLVSSDYCIDMMSDQLNLEKKQLICVGNPRNDIIFKPTNIKEKLSEFKKFNKIILWLPTFRKSATSDRSDSSFEFPLGLPIIYNIKELKKLNKYLKDNNIAILFKLHPAQDSTLLKTTNLSNIIVLQDSYLIQKDVQLTELFKITDAMITDYSGVYYDYLLLDNLIGFTMDDFDKYKEEKGFVFENPKEFMAGEQIYNINELYDFIKNVINGNDIFKEKRNEMKILFNKYDDDLSSERLAKYLKL